MYTICIILFQRIREQLIRDFDFINHLCPDPRLISDSCDPSMMGPCKGKDALLTTISYFDWLTTLTKYPVVHVYLTEGSTFPTHWYRMKAFDEAADFGRLKFCDVGIYACVTSFVHVFFFSLSRTHTHHPFPLPLQFPATMMLSMVYHLLPPFLPLLHCQSFSPSCRYRAL